MRITNIALIFLALTAAAGAETLRLPSTNQPQSGKTLPLRGAATSKANGCASYGLGFTMVGGTCVKIGGTVSVDAVTRR